MVRRRWRWGALVALLLSGIGLLLWWMFSPGVEASDPVAKVTREKPRLSKHPVRSHPVSRPSPEAVPVEEEQEEEAELAIPIDEEPPPEVAEVMVEVLDFSGAPVEGVTIISDCRIFPIESTSRRWPWAMFTDAGGVAEGMKYGEAEACAIAAVRPDGLLFTRSDEQRVELVPGEVVDISLTLPKERTGGVGIQFQPKEDGVLVEKVIRGTPAWSAGLENGDLIVEVDGLPAATLTAEEFRSVMTGPENTDISFVVAYEGDTGWGEETHVVTRQFLERSLVR